MRPRIAIVGAGIAGLACAQRLRGRGLAPVVLEKSRSLGGRCATRRWENHVVDHGAQFFTASSPGFQAFLAGLPSEAVGRLAAPVVDPAGTPIPSPRGSRLFHREGNNRLGKALAEGIALRMETPVGPLRRRNGSWEAAGEEFDAVVLTPPWPQAAAIAGLDGSAPTYVPCLTAFFEYAMPWTGMAHARYAVRDPSDATALAWSACENHKPGRIAPGKVVFVVQASAAFSRDHLEETPEAYLPPLRAALEQVWELDPSTRGPVFAHRWRYARPAAPAPLPALPENLFAAGDGFAPRARVEDAWESGCAAALAVLDRFAI